METNEHRIKNVAKEVVSFYEALLAKPNIIFEEEKSGIFQVSATIAKLTHEFRDMEFTLQQRDYIANTIQFILIVIDIIRERCTALNDATIIVNKASKAISRPSAKSSEFVFNVITPSQVKKSNYQVFGRSRHFSSETRHKLESWYQEGCLDKESVRQIADDVNLDLVQVKNWVSNRKRKEKKDVDEIIKETLKRFGPLSGNTFN